MSWSFSGSNALTGTLSIAKSSWNGGVTLTAWVKKTTQYSNAGIVDLSQGDADPRLFINQTGSWYDNAEGFVKNPGQGSVTTTNGSNTSPYNQWNFQAVRFTNSSHELASFANLDKATDTTLTYDWPDGNGGPNEVLSRIDINQNYSGSKQTACKVAHIAIWNAPLTDEEIGLLAGGGNPEDVALSKLLHYWYDSKTDRIGSVTLTDDGGTVSWDSGDDPTVDAPPSSQSVVPILMSHYN